MGGPRLFGILGSTILFTLYFTNSNSFITHECNKCYAHTIEETEYSGYIYPSQAAAKQACLRKWSQCGSHLGTGDANCIRRYYGPLCWQRMQYEHTRYRNIPQRCYFTEAQLSECIQASALWELGRTQCYTSQRGGYWQYEAPGRTHVIPGHCSGWTCQNCEYNRVACQHRVFCEFNPILPTKRYPTSVSDYTRYCPSPHVMKPSNEHYWRSVRQYRGNSFVEEGAEADCVNEYLGCHIPCTVDPRTPKGVNYGRCLTNCICRQFTWARCVGFSNVIHGAVRSMVRQKIHSLSGAVDISPTNKSHGLSMNHMSEESGSILTVNRQWGASINVPRCKQACRHHLVS